MNGVAWTCCGVHASRVHRPSKKPIRSSSRRRGQAYVDDDIRTARRSWRENLGRG